MAARLWYHKGPTEAEVRRAVRFALENEPDVAKLAAFADALETLEPAHGASVKRLRERVQLLSGRQARAQVVKKKKPRRHPRGRAVKNARASSR